jgi:hypothetical protein
LIFSCLFFMFSILLDSIYHACYVSIGFMRDEWVSFLRTVCASCEWVPWILNVIFYILYSSQTISGDHISCSFEVISFRKFVYVFHLVLNKVSMQCPIILCIGKFQWLDYLDVSHNYSKWRFFQILDSSIFHKPITMHCVLQHAILQTLPCNNLCK